MFKKRRDYAVLYHSMFSNFSFNDKDRVKYEATIEYTNSGVAYYKIKANFFEYIRLWIRFFIMRHTPYESIVVIRRMKD